MERCGNGRERKKKKTLNSVKRVNIDKIPQHNKSFSVYFHCTIAGWNKKFHKLIKMHYKFQFFVPRVKKAIIRYVCFWNKQRWMLFYCLSHNEDRQCVILSTKYIISIQKKIEHFAKKIKASKPHHAIRLCDGYSVSSVL